MIHLNLDNQYYHVQNNMGIDYRKLHELKCTMDVSVLGVFHTLPYIFFMIAPVGAFHVLFYRREG